MAQHQWAAPSASIRAFFLLKQVVALRFVYVQGLQPTNHPFLSSRHPFRLWNTNSPLFGAIDRVDVPTHPAASGMNPTVTGCCPTRRCLRRRLVCSCRISRSAKQWTTKPPMLVGRPDRQTLPGPGPLPRNRQPLACSFLLGLKLPSARFRRSSRPQSPGTPSKLLTGRFEACFEN